MPRFVVLTHDHPVLHWDLMLETDSTLRTWRLSQSPDFSGSIATEPLGNHRRAYLDYEGPVSGGRGVVKRWDAGHYKLLEESPTRLAVQMSGAKLCGIAVIELSMEDAAGTFHFTAD